MNVLGILIVTLAAVSRAVADNFNRTITPQVFAELEELSRLVDISYCVGVSGVYPPFTCVSRCSDFPGFELVETWNTGPLLSDSCGYIALSHAPFAKRIIVAFRGTYSLTNTIIDLSTVPQEYVPYPDDGDEVSAHEGSTKHQAIGSKCADCRVHMGFYTSWKLARSHIYPHVERLKDEHPDYELTLVGHSMGGSVAALAALEFDTRGWEPHITTFGEPRLGNAALAEYIDQRFAWTNSTNQHADGVRPEPAAARYRRVTHVRDPVPLLPLEEWGYVMHSNEIFIEKGDLPPATADVRFCNGNNDSSCIFGTSNSSWSLSKRKPTTKTQQAVSANDPLPSPYGIIPPRFKIWELLFAHRDYFWRIGLCVPGGDPRNWYGRKPEAIMGDIGIVLEEL